MSPTSEVMLGALALTPVPAEVYDHAFEAVTGYCPWPKAYGGDMVAQSLLAAQRTVEGKHMHSSHSYFMRPVDIGQPVRYEVEVLRDGRGYATRHVRGFQGGKPVFVTMASFAVGGAGAEHALPAPAGLPQPEELPSSAEYLAGRLDEGAPEWQVKAVDYWSTGRSFDMRHVPGPLYVEVAGERVPHQGVWLRAFSALPADPLLHRAALAYACDYTIIEPTLRVLGIDWLDEGLVTASLDHAMWFHRDAPVDDWLLYAQESVAAHDERGLGMGRFYTRDGELVATVVQEAMIRPPKG